MGGCCCSFSRRRAELSGTPVYYYCPQNLEEHASLSSSHGGTSAISTGLLVDRNLETSIPDTYRAPPAPLPYDVDVGTHHQIRPGHSETNAKSTPIAGENISGYSLESLLASEDAEIDAEDQSDSKDDILKPELGPLKANDSSVLTIYDEDVCPICLEEYVSENPRTVTKCEHHFHLACILEWMERSDSCPICDQEVIFDQNFEH